ncbi:uncharacterized protein ppp1r3aa isoform X2 [Parambassis ranga]|uniref:Uncharacterized protein ppp1r3aa isoform X2 n=1 Tax=Parambassis ranga TaxID=210632 RepID=A0A6P7HTB8_9TELE|nr:protein phosphatase 1 regulatory subunit 3A isoform X2 [Parambassis ranga]
MEALDFQPLQEDVVMMEEVEEEEEEEREKTGEWDEGVMEASATDEETDEDSEPEPPPLVRRKVSFADAFGLDLVSVKEFDNVEMESEVSRSNEMEVSHSQEEFYLSCLFTVPSSPEELDQRLETQMAELESIELLPGTTTLRGIIRVVNLCYTKFVYTRISLDRWKSYFDLLAEYVPGSSDRKTDRFTFQYILVPPFEREGTRVEFCLRYETSVGTFWANNNGINYVLFCHQKGQIKDQVQEESCSYKSKRSCLKANRNGSAEEKTTATVAAVEATHKAEKAERKRMDSSEMQSLLYCEEHKPLVESIKSRQRTARLARVQDYFSQRRQRAPKTFPHDSVANGQKVSQPVPAPWGDSASFLFKSQKTQPIESPQVLTYHQIPLLTLDWNNDKPQQWGAAEVDDIWTGRAKRTLSKAENTPDTWKTFLSSTDDTNNKETSVCDTWQAFLNGPSCKDHSAVPESEWLQTAASVSPSNDKVPQTQYTASSQEFGEFQVGRGSPTTLHAHTLPACQPLSDTHETLFENVTLNTKDHQPAEACVSSPTDNTDASQRSQTDSVTDTTQEFSLKGATPVSEDSVDSSAECHKQVVWEGEREGIIGVAGGIGDEPFTLHTADLVTSSGELETTEMTAMPESQNASATDRISQGAARLDEGLSSSGEVGVTGTMHNAVDDMLAFRETIRQGTKDGVTCFCSTSRQGAEERNTRNYMEEEIFRLKCEQYISPSTYADENQNGENCLRTEEEGDEDEMHADRVGLNENCEENEVPLNNKEISNEQQQMANTAVSLDKQSKQAGEERCFLKKENSQTEQETAMLNKTVEVGRSSCDTITKEQQEMNPSAQPRPTEETREMKKAGQSDKSRSCPTDKWNPNPLEVIELRWTHSRDNMKGQMENEGKEMKPEEVIGKENIAKKDTSTEQQAETSERTKGNTSQEDEGIGKPKMEAMRELMGNVESPRGERQNAPAELKELLAEVESSPRVEYKKLPHGTKKPITPVKTASLQEMGLVDMFVEDFAKEIWEEIFARDVTATYDGTDTTKGCHLLDKDFNDTCDSGVFSLIELPTDLDFSLGLEQTVVTRGNVCSPKSSTTEQSHFLSEVQADLNSSAHLSQDHNRQSLTESSQALSSPNDQETCSLIKERSVTRQETGRQIEDCAVVRKEGFNRSHKHLTSSSEKLKEPDGLVWWSKLYILSHILRLLIYALLVGGFFVVIFLSDFPACFALYVLSLCWWYYKWRRDQVTANKGMVG